MQVSLDRRKQVFVLTLINISQIFLGPNRWRYRCSGKTCVPSGRLLLLPEARGRREHFSPWLSPGLARFVHGYRACCWWSCFPGFSSTNESQSEIRTLALLLVHIYMGFQSHPRTQVSLDLVMCPSVYTPPAYFFHLTFSSLLVSNFVSHGVQLSFAFSCRGKVSSIRLGWREVGLPHERASGAKRVSYLLLFDRGNSVCNKMHGSSTLVKKKKNQQIHWGTRLYCTISYLYPWVATPEKTRVSVKWRCTYVFAVTVSALWINETFFIFHLPVLFQYMIYGFLSPMTSLMDFQRFGPMTIEILIVLKLLSRKLYPSGRKPRSKTLLSNFLVLLIPLWNFPHIDIYRDSIV